MAETFLDESTMDREVIIGAVSRCREPVSEREYNVICHQEAIQGTTLPQILESKGP